MAAPLFILSFRQRDELSRIAAAAGWQPIAGRRAAEAEARFVASGAAVALVDARGAAGEAAEAVRMLGEAVQVHGGALLVLLSRTDEDRLGDMLDLGATHFLVSPFSEVQLHQALRYAARLAARVGGRAVPVPTIPAAQESWRWQLAARHVSVDATLGRKLGLPDGTGEVPLRIALRQLGREGRSGLRLALARLRPDGEGTAFAHADPAHPGGRLAHHLRRAADGGLTGRTESLASGRGRAGDSRDALTGIADARAARAWLADRLTEGGAPVALLVALTRFDAINHAFGRACGDVVLQAAAQRIVRASEAGEQAPLVARLAGAEFAVLLPDGIPIDAARALADTLLEGLARPFAAGDHLITAGSRIGIAVSRLGDNAAILLRRAGAALAEAKAQDSAAVSLIDADAERAQAQGGRLEVDLRRALGAGEIDILFQPQVRLATGAIVGVEALARWNHPQHGALGAETLFGVAERSDYLVQLSDHIHRRALRVVAGWPAELSHLRLAVNVTAQDMVRPGFATHFLDLVRASGLAPERITVEVTESGLIEDLDAAAALLAELRDGGLKTAIDDFGTGYSSLAYLKALPLDYLKLDHGLCADIVGSPRDRVVVSSVIDMARSLGLAVIAEGVETREQLALLREEGAALYQGFLCAPPLPTAALRVLVRNEAERARGGVAA